MGGWLELRSSQLICLTHPSFPAAFEKCHEAKQRLGPCTPGAPDGALRPHHATFPRRRA